VKRLIRKLLELLKDQKGQVGMPVIITVAILTTAFMVLIPAIALSLGEGTWSTRGAKEYLERNGYSVVVPTAGITTGDLIPNTDSMWDIGASGNEFAEGHTDYVTLDGSLVGVTGMMDTFMDVLALDIDAIVDDEALEIADPTVCTIVAQPDVPRRLDLVFTHPTLTAYTLVIIGTNAQGNAATETWTELDGFILQTENAFATVTSITVSAMDNEALGDLLNVGTSETLGLSSNINATGDIYKIVKNAVNQTIAAGQVDVDFNTYDMSVIGLAATNDFTIWYNGNISHTN